MHDPDAFLYHIGLEGLFPRYEEPDLVSHIDQVVGEIDRCRYDTVGLWIENVEPEGYMHQDSNPLFISL